MKIVMLSDVYPPRIGGMGRHVHVLSQELVSRGHKVAVLTTGYRDLPKYEERDSLKVWRLDGLWQKVPFLYKNPENKKPPPIRDWLITRELIRIVKEIEPEIIHAHGWILYSILPLKNRLRHPLVATLHDYGLICPKTTLLRGDSMCDEPFTGKCLDCGKDQYGVVKSLFAYWATKLNRDKLKSIDKFVAVSSFVRQAHLKHLGLESDKIAVIPNFYAIEMSVKALMTRELPEDFILFVGGLVPSKGVNVLIEAYRKLDTTTKLVLIGAKHPAYHYKSRDDILGIENAPYEVVMEAYQRCQFAVCPSIWPEPCPTVAFEAMSHKKAVIATSTGGFTDIVVDGETGILVTPSDVEALSSAISYLMENPDIAEEMGEKGYQRWLDKFTPDAVVPRIEEIYQSLA